MDGVESGWKRRQSGSVRRHRRGDKRGDTLDRKRQEETERKREMEIKRMRKRQRQKERGIVNGLHLYCALQERKRESEREMERKTERQVNPIFESWKEAAERRQPRGTSRSSQPCGLPWAWHPSCQWEPGDDRAWLTGCLAACLPLPACLPAGPRTWAQDAERHGYGQRRKLKRRKGDERQTPGAVFTKNLRAKSRS